MCSLCPPQSQCGHTTMLTLLLEARAAAEVGCGLQGKWWSVAFYFYTLSFHLYTDKGTAAFNLTSKSQAWYGNLSSLVDATLNWPMRLKCQLLSSWQLCVASVVGLFCCLFNFCSSSWGSGVREKLCSHSTHQRHTEGCSGLRWY